MTRPLALLPTQFPRFLLGIDHVCVSITRIIFIRVNTNIDRVKNVLETRKCPPLKLINFINFNSISKIIDTNRSILIVGIFFSTIDTSDFTLESVSRRIRFVAR